MTIVTAQKIGSTILYILRSKRKIFKNTNCLEQQQKAHIVPEPVTSCKSYTQRKMHSFKIFQ